MPIIVKTLLAKIPLWVWVVVVSGGYIAYQHHKISVINEQRIEALFAQDSVVQINSSMKATLAHTEIQRDSFKDELAAAKKLGAKPIAIAHIKLAPDSVHRDTVKVVTTINSDSVTRVSRVSDTTSAGVLNATLTAPPFPADLRFDYDFIPAPLNVSVSVLSLSAKRAAFLVKYNGGQSTVTTSYAGIPAAPKILEPYIAGLWSFSNHAPEFRAGAQLNIHSWAVVAELSQVIQSNSGADLLLGLRKSF